MPTKKQLEYENAVLKKKIECYEKKTIGFNLKFKNIPKNMMPKLEEVFEVIRALIQKQ